MKVLLYCPLNPQPPRIYARTIQSIMTLDWNYPLEVVFGKDDKPKEGQHGYDNLIEKHNRARDIVLNNDFDALFYVEADMIIPSNALTRLAAIKTDVAYGLYCSRHGRYQWLAFTEVGKRIGRSVDRNKLYCSEQWGKVIPTQGVGMGCTLIHRHVLEKLVFRREGHHCDDWYFSLDCIEKGLRQHHDLGVVCGHISREVKNKPMIIWPTIADDMMYKLEVM